MRDVNYFKKLYSLDRNRGSLDVQSGVAQGEFLGFNYFLKLRKGNFYRVPCLIKGFLGAASAGNNEYVHVK